MNSDLLVIGGGLHGLSIALHAARRGASVHLLEAQFLGRHASGATAAGVRTLGRDPAELPLSLDAAETWHHMQDLVGDDCGFKACGQLQVAETDEALSKIKARIQSLESRGLFHEQLVDQSTIRELSPAISPHCLGGAWVANDGSADPHRTIRAFQHAALREGVTIHQQCPVTALTRETGLWHVKTAKDVFRSPLVVNAAGAWAGRMSAMAGDHLQHSIRTSMMVVTERVSARIGPVISSLGRKLSFKQTAEGTLLIGGGAQGQLAPDRNSASVDMVALRAAVGSAVNLFPSMNDVRIVRVWAGMEAMTVDRLPVIGFSEQIEGLIHVFGFSGHGFQLIPSVGRAVADLVVSGTTDFNLDAFAPSRVAAEKAA